MGFVWTVMLSFGDEEYWRSGEEEMRENCEALDNINAWLRDHPERHGPLTDLTRCSTGNAVGMNASLYGGGFKHFVLDDFIEVVKNQDWQDPASVQLFIKADDDQLFTAMLLADM